MNHVHAGLKRGGRGARRSAAPANWRHREVYLKGDGSKMRLLAVTANCCFVLGGHSGVSSQPGGPLFLSQGVCTFSLCQRGFFF